MNYYESHITIEPVFEEELEKFKNICSKYKFRVAELLLQKRKIDKPEISTKDTFCTGRFKDLETAKNDTLSLVEELKENVFIVKRYKVEYIVLDVRL